MPKTQVNSLIDDLRRCVLSQEATGMTDAELLGHFVDRRDSNAFELLVRRHGPLVIGVCHRVLGHRQDAEDAFQAAFLVLACKASSVKPRSMLANWLHGVAHRSALNARTMRTKKQFRERQVRELPEPESIEHSNSSDLRQSLDRELNALPANYRLPILLCDLEGKSIKEATQQLGWRQGTLAGRLARGRKMLAMRLAKRGFALSAASLATIASYDVASAGVTETLVHSTVTTAGLVAAGGAAIRGVASARIAALAEGVMKAMRYSKVKIASVILFAAAIMFGGSALIPTTSNAGQTEAPEQKPAARDEVAKDSGFKPGEVREFEIAPGVKMKFCWIPMGEAQLGSTKVERDKVEKFFAGRNGAQPSEAQELRGKFKTKGFWLAKYPTTQSEWKTVMGDNPSIYSSTRADAANLKGLDTSRFPVDSVSWVECNKFMERLNDRSGAGKVFGRPGKFSLPHEDEWEYACRGGKGNDKPYYFGNSMNGTEANCMGFLPFGTETRGPSLDRPTTVGQYESVAPHPWGLCDLHGNVWQWCENKFAENENVRVIRGGSFSMPPVRCRSADRWDADKEQHRSDFGFRVCFRLEDSGKPKISVILTSKVQRRDRIIVVAAISNNGDAPIEWDTEFAVPISWRILTDQDKPLEIESVKTLERDEKVTSRDRFKKLQPGEKFSKEIELTKEFKVFGTGHGTYSGPAGSYHVPTGYESFSKIQIPTGVSSLRIQMVDSRPGIGFLGGFKLWFGYEAGSVALVDQGFASNVLKVDLSDKDETLPKPGEVREFEIAPGVKMKFCWIPPGEAQLGAPDEEQGYVTGWFADGVRPAWMDAESEAKRGKFVSKGFWLGKNLVTQGEWQAVMGRNPSWFAVGGGGANKVAGLDTSRFPVEQVSRNDGAAFLAKVNEQGGREKRFGKGQFVLPHENEWEYACRGGRGNQKPYYFGDFLNGAQANCDVRRFPPYLPHIPVSEKQLKTIAARLKAPPRVRIEQAVQLPLSSWLQQFQDMLWGSGFTIRVNEESLERESEITGPIKAFGAKSPRVEIPGMPAATLHDVLMAVLSKLNLTYRLNAYHVEILRLEDRDKPDDRLPSYQPASSPSEKYQKAIARLKAEMKPQVARPTERSLSWWLDSFGTALGDSKFDIRISEALLKEKPELKMRDESPQVRVQALNYASLESVMMEVFAKLDLTYIVHDDFIEVVKIKHDAVNNLRIALERTTEVGKYESIAPHPWGLCDVHGNVWQWCENWYDGEHLKRAIRGGSWNSGPANCRSAHRFGALPDSTSNDCGFRVCFRPE